MRVKPPVTTILGIAVEVLYAFSIMLVAFIICLALTYTTPLENPARKGGDEGGFSIPPLGTPKAYSPGGLHLR